jgi:hypothetical protein
MSLGAAGCKYTEKDAFCGHIERTPSGFNCKKHHIELVTCPRLGEPFRAKECGDDAGDAAWSHIMRNRR